MSTPEPPVSNSDRSTSWKLVLAVLLLGPLFLSAILSRWLGSSTEGLSREVVFGHLGSPTFSESDVQSLAYGHLLFVRLRLSSAARLQFVKGLATYDVAHGQAEPPTTLALERDWWDPPKGVAGTRWVRGSLTLWSADRDPNLFYIVDTQGLAKPATP